MKWKLFCQRVREHLPSALGAAFTGCLVFIGYVTERPLIVARPSPLQNFSADGKPRELVFFENIGHQPAYSLTIGQAIDVHNCAVFPTFEFGTLMVRVGATEDQYAR